MQEAKKVKDPTRNNGVWGTRFGDDRLASETNRLLIVFVVTRWAIFSRGGRFYQSGASGSALFSVS
jgi:hypothetical protein